MPIDIYKFYKERLEDIISSAKYQPPESQWIWKEIGQFVNEMIPYPPEEEWHKKVVNTLINEERY